MSDDTLQPLYVFKRANIVIYTDPLTMKRALDSKSKVKSLITVKTWITIMRPSLEWKRNAASRMKCSLRSVPGKLEQGQWLHRFPVGSFQQQKLSSWGGYLLRLILYGTGSKTQPRSDECTSKDVNVPVTSQFQKSFINALKIEKYLQIIFDIFFICSFTPLG